MAAVGCTEWKASSEERYTGRRGLSVLLQVHRSVHFDRLRVNSIESFRAAALRIGVAKANGALQLASV